MWIPIITFTSALALGVAARPGGEWSGWHGHQKSHGWTTKVWGTTTWSEPWPSPTASVSYVGSPPSYTTTSPGGYTRTGWWPGQPTPPTPCLTSEEATQVANNFRDTIASPFSTPLAEAAFSPTFNDYSDSVIELIDSGCGTPVPLGSATFNSLAAFIAGQSGQAPIPFTILNLWYSCNSVHIRWVSQPGPGTVQPEQQVTGIIAIEVVPNSGASSYPWLIQTVYSEFNSGAWLYDLGVFVPTNCSATAKKRSLPML